MISIFIRIGITGRDHMVVDDTLEAVSELFIDMRAATFRFLDWANDWVIKAYRKHSILDSKLLQLLPSMISSNGRQFMRTGYLADKTL